MPEQLGSLEHARQAIRALVDWYNDDHYHLVDGSRDPS